MSTDVKLSGTVKWYNNDKGYGFIQMPGMNDVFVHSKQLKSSGISRPLVEGETVTFQTNRGPKGPFAVDIATE